jgi:maleate cis-trans isomerase
MYGWRAKVEVKMALQGQEVEGIFLSGTGVHSLDIIRLLEADLGLPVVFSNTAVLWSVLCRLGITPLARWRAADAAGL